jgi:hypothetical protein
LDTLKWLFGGIDTQAILISYNKLSKWDMQRAKNLEILTCTAGQLKNLSEFLIKWIK